MYKNGFINRIVLTVDIKRLTNAIGRRLVVESQSVGRDGVADEGRGDGMADERGGDGVADERSVDDRGDRLRDLQREMSGERRVQLPAGRRGLTL